ncbi:MAG: hypothetical protein ACI4RC_03170 [Oscillospiraceae bacterium]
MFSKKIIACALSLVLAGAAAAADFSALGTDFSVCAAASSNYAGIYDLKLGTNTIVTRPSNSSDVLRYKFKLTTSGTLSVSTLNLYSTKLYNSNGVELGYIYSSSKTDMYLNAGSYYIDTNVSYSGNGQILANFVPSKETFVDSGESITTNNTIKLPSTNNKSVTVNGFVATDSGDKSDSYKINVSERTGIAIVLSKTGNSYPSFNLEVYNSKKSKVFQDDYATVGDKNYVKLNKGTYYIKVTSLYPTSYPGSYSLKLTKYNPKTAHVLKVNTSKVNNKSVSDYSGCVKYSTNYSYDTVKFASSNKNIFTVNKYGTVEFKNPGKAYLTVTAGSSAKYDAVSKKVPIIVTPKKISGFNKKMISHTKKTVTSKIYWNRDKYASGYVVKYSSKIKNGKLVSPKTIKLNSNKKNYFLFKNQKAGTKTYFNVRAYKTIDKKVYYGPISSTMYYKVYSI